MDELRRILEKTLNEDLEGMILSNSRDASLATKAKIRPILIGGSLRFQETRYQGTKVFHENYEKGSMILRLEEELQSLFRQCEIKAKELSAVVLVSKKGKMTIKEKKMTGQATASKTSPDKNSPEPKTPEQITPEQKTPEQKTPEQKTPEQKTPEQKTPEQKTPEKNSPEKKQMEALAHDRVKHYILPEGEPVDFLVGLGVQTPDGRVTKNRYDKFRQINRYLEFIEDVLDELPKDRMLHVVDFGCGKSYLTFAMYYYLHVKEGRDLQVTGLDLKEDVIRHCNELAQKLHYDRLHFEQGDIQNFEGENHVDMVVSLHACDLATDYALEKAVKWGAEVILAVPCCQHELNRQIKNDVLRPVLKYGIIKERMAALMTDALRAEILEENGYDAQILEFIDVEHTPKNLLIRAVRRKKMGKINQGQARRNMEKFLEVSPALERLLDGKEKSLS